MEPGSKVLEELVILNFGCKISEDKFLVLWKKPNVSVTFEMELKSLHFCFSYDGFDYKLELQYDTIYRIELRCPRGQLQKFLLIQLRGAPRIYKKDATSFSNNHWVRDVDFTPSCCIGQSSSICLELPLRCALPVLRKSFVNYKENKGHFLLKEGRTFSGHSALVPVLAPPKGIDLPYRILFKINLLVQHGRIPGPALNVNFYQLVDPTRRRIEYIHFALDKLVNYKGCCYEPARVQITPVKVYFCGPEVNLSNRVLRNFHEDIDNFLRVSFVDEDLGKMHAEDLYTQTSFTGEERKTRVYERILSTLRDGIVIGDKKFEFLAFSKSQLREHSVWMFASRRGLNAQGIRDWMGDFSRIKNVAKYAIRLGQSFSSSWEAFSVGLDEFEVIPDVEIERQGIQYCFSDGIGKISAEFAERVARKCGIRYTPSAFQIRYGGYKGVVAVDPTSSKKLSLRKSMLKFESGNTKLDVLAWSKYQPYFLNRQVITLLSTLGVKDHVFEKKQTQVLNQLEGILADPLKAQEALRLMFQGEATNMLYEMLMVYKPNEEPFLSFMLRSLCASKLAQLRKRTRIFIQHGRSLKGCLDETGTLEYGQVFVQCSHRDIFSGGTTSTATNHGSFTIEAAVVVAKNPCLHPGDVRVFLAVDVPALHHMVDCVVFPQKGNRPHPNECSGSDLDGDDYFVSWDRDLIPPRQVEPMDYTPEPTVEIDHNVTVEEVEESFTDFIRNFKLGVISNAHLIFADRKRKKAMSVECIELAKLHSRAVDSPKTGVSVKVPSKLRAHIYPDFMDKTHKQTYESKRVIGKLFRQVKDLKLGSHSQHSFKSFTREVAKKFYDPDMEIDGFKDYINDAISYKSEYDYKLGTLMDYYGIKTEAEILSGSISNVSKFFNQRKDMESINYAVRSLKKEARKWFIEKPNSDDQLDIEDDIGMYAAKASAWYHVTYHHRYWGCYNKGMTREHFLSFPWCVFDVLVLIKRYKKSNP
ncbi:probable RNA-dependent RNA polymerase 1 isoform X2 [Argentina anserina]|uniref:probable RNA-dependent RNA polymerase 1 isoform X2 n=1 Tax=Argentina anserina TaxID=57926 RepID=UPI0021765571|nr:probable RNA-dependent RNA polymerase 1 isoform X2 [Potentilla anserina]